MQKPDKKILASTPVYQSKSEEFNCKSEGGDLDIDMKCHPNLPDACLVGLAGDIVTLITSNSEADRSAVLITLLILFGACCGSGVHVNVGETKHPPRLFAAIVGASSRARKGTSFDPINRIIQRVGELNSARVCQISYGPSSSGEGLTFAVRDASEEKKKDSDDPVDPGATDKRLFVLEGELGAPLKAIQREGNTLSAVLRTAWDHGNINPLTKNNRTKVTAGHICMVGHITGLELRGLLSTSDIFNGLANRFLWICSRRQKLIAFPRPLEPHLVDDLAKRLLSAIDFAADSTNIELDRDAQQMWAGIYPLLTQDQPGITGVITARAEAQVIRLALIYALLDLSPSIRSVHLEAAMSLWQYAAESASYIFGDSEPEPHINKILAALSDGEKTQTDLNRLFDSHLPAPRLKTILRDLESSGRVTQRKEKGQGRAITFWSITPGF